MSERSGRMLGNDDNAELEREFCSKTSKIKADVEQLRCCTSTKVRNHQGEGSLTSPARNP